MAPDAGLRGDLAAWDVLVGRVVGHWDRASLKVRSFSPNPSRFAAGACVCALVGKERILLEIATSRKSGHAFLVDCGLTDTPAAERFRGAELFIHRSMRPPLPAGEYYPDELLGVEVVTTSGEALGAIVEVLETPAHNVYVTPHAMIPAHRDFIAATDLEQRVLTVHDIPGLRTDEG